MADLTHEPPSSHDAKGYKGRKVFFLASYEKLGVLCALAVKKILILRKVN